MLLRNDDPVVHTFTSDVLGVDETLLPGDEVLVDPNDFESTTRQSWDTFSASNPEVADYLAREARILAIGYLGLAAVVFAMGDGGVLAAFYAVVTVIAAGSLVAAHRGSVGQTDR